MNEKFALVTLDDKRKETRGQSDKLEPYFIDKPKNDESLS